jgi:capsular exopolysaccharide synthesis family protein
MRLMRKVDPRVIEAGSSGIVEATHSAAQDGITAQDFLRVIQRRFWVIAFFAVLLTGMTVAYSLYQTPMYEASIKIIVRQKAPTDSLGSDVDGLQRLTQTMTQAIQTRPVTKDVIQELNLRVSPKDFLQNHLTAQQISDTQFIEVSYLHANPEQARRIVNAVGDEFSRRVPDVSPTRDAVTATVWERATTPDVPISPDILRNGLLAFVIGSMLGVGLAFLLDNLDDSWRSPEDMEQLSGVSTLGLIPRVENPKARMAFKAAANYPNTFLAGEEQATANLSESLKTTASRDGAALEAYRTLRTNLLYARPDVPPKAIVVTSPGPKEGKTTICANLGVVLAQADKNVLILDCDLRKPAMHKMFGLQNLWGIVDVLIGEYSLQEIWQEPLPQLKVATVGCIPPNPPELLGSERFVELLDQTRQEFDYILLDVPPTQLVSDSMIAATQGDGVLLVIDAERTRKRDAWQSIRSLESVGTPVLGTVANNVKPSKGIYNYDYAYS